MKQLPTYIFIAILLIFAGLLGYNRFKRPFFKQDVAKTETVQQEKPIENNNFADFTAREKVARLLVVPVALQNIDEKQPVTPGSTRISTLYSPATLEWLQKNKPGAVILVGKQSASISAQLAVAQIATASGLMNRPILIAVNQASQTRFVPATRSLPQPSTLSANCNLSTDTAATQWNDVAKLWREMGINIIVGPVIDQPTPDSWVKNLGCANYSKSMELARAFISSFGRNGILPVLAHFPGTGSASSNPKSGDQLLQVELADVQPFKDLLIEFPNIGVITTAAKIAGQFDEKPCSLSASCLADFPKKYSKSLLIADGFGPLLAAEENKPVADLMAEAVMAGNQMLVVDESLNLSEIEVIINQLVIKYTDNQEFHQKIDAAFNTIISLTKPVAEIDQATPSAQVSTKPTGVPSINSPTPVFDAEQLRQ